MGIFNITKPKVNLRDFLGIKFETKLVTSEAPNWGKIVVVKDVVANDKIH